VIPIPDRSLYDDLAAAQRREPFGDRWLEVRTYEGNSDIWRVGVDEDLRLTSNPAADYDPAWSPAGAHIAFVSGRGGSDDLFVMEADLGGERQLTYYGGFDKHPTWSPDGTRLAFWSDRQAGRRQIWVINLDGSGLANLGNSPYQDWDPVWVK
jgi:Tol biopolymer transport system component